MTNYDWHVLNPSPDDETFPSESYGSEVSGGSKVFVRLKPDRRRREQPPLYRRTIGLAVVGMLAALVAYVVIREAPVPPVPSTVTLSERSVTAPVTPPPPAAVVRAETGPAPTRVAEKRPDHTGASLLPVALPVRTAFSPSFAQSGTSILFHTERDARSALMRAQLTETGDVGTVERLLDDGAKNFHPRPSPDGRLIAFDSDREGERAVYVAQADGTEIRRISRPGYAAVPTWSPDGRKLAFITAESSRPKVWNLAVMDLETGAVTAVSRHRVGQVWAGAWFPDSKRICYSHEKELVVVDIESGKAVRYASPKDGRLARTPAVSPDGARVAFQVYRDGVWLLDLASGSMQRILDDATAEEFEWAPNGRRLAFHSRRGGAWGLWMMTIG